MEFCSRFFASFVAAQQRLLFDNEGRRFRYSLWRPGFGICQRAMEYNVCRFEMPGQEKPRVSDMCSV